ncbi:aminodeoxychorismate synthase component I [Lipingzhangella sp. LS1_29]|uniref:aminodeoxychorismate synthase n=1 Tax=Lipingzhangella rawalii TaxID=2055835 RepID=A0ABU2H120_9ACTN|nr:aminodeoxychorismate synthase component I [Lipingzhangella rawalii]MDS1268991.1 aminodeoxychorismate synthase component I [Lipingzhangella rawalii]
MRILLVDNHDSYTYNLFQLLASVAATPPTVVTNDDAAWSHLDLHSFDAAVVSPGPGRPQHPRDIGHGIRILDDAQLPVLGVCLGHQLLAHHSGAEIALAPAPRHGHLTRVRHDGTGPFAELPQGFTAVRYHSLAATEPLPADLRATAWAEDGVLMGLAHRELPRWGVQFHPESIATEHGRDLVTNFLALARRAAGSPQRSATATNRTTSSSSPPAPHRPPRADASPPAHIEPEGNLRLSDGDRVWWSTLDREIDTEAIFRRCYAAAPYAVWLDSSQAEAASRPPSSANAAPDPHTDTARFSFLGAPDGPRAQVLHYRVASGAVVVTDAHGTEHTESGTILDALRGRVTGHPSPTPFPFDFAGGYVGYLGYEVKADCGFGSVHRSAAVPDAVWVRLDRFVVVDHVARRTYVVARGRDTTTETSASRTWVQTMVAALATIEPAGTAADVPPPPEPAAVERWLPLSRGDYLSRVKECLGHLAAGESYELCLTTQLHAPAPADELDFYHRLRYANPAPYGALLRLGELTVHSASPERFLRIDDTGTVDSRPIKGTAPRHHDPTDDARAAADLRTDPKTRAENLMIVDLLRNDLGRVCEVGTVTVPQFMYTRSYATVHQLISTVRGQLRSDAGPLDAIAACFPGGSMTGAPKRRTCAILDELEDEPRGVYSGTLGYIGYDGGTDLSIVIRTAVRSHGELRIGAGGAIVLDSDPDAEYREMVTKAAVPLRAHRALDSPISETSV